jgi:hypothetical protein
MKAIHLNLLFVIWISEAVRIVTSVVDILQMKTTPFPTLDM